MPRKPTSDEALQYARFFLNNFIQRTDNADHILPKNDMYSPYLGFCRVFPQYAKKKDGGFATDGVSRAAFNKICLEYFEEGMRKPARNGNPGALDPNLAQQRRHFLRGRWRDPSSEEDDMFLRTVFTSLNGKQKTAASELLSEFSRWKPGPAGRGGERLSKKRGCALDSTGSDEDAISPALPWLASCVDILSDSSGRSSCESPFSAAPTSPDSTSDSAPASKRLCPLQAASRRRGTGDRQRSPGLLLDILCMVASSVDADSHLPALHTSAPLAPLPPRSPASPRDVHVHAGAAAVLLGSGGPLAPGAAAGAAERGHVMPLRDFTELPVLFPPPPAALRCSQPPAPPATAPVASFPLPALAAATDPSACSPAHRPAAAEGLSGGVGRGRSVASLCCSPFPAPAASPRSPPQLPLGPAPAACLRGADAARGGQAGPPPFANLFLGPAAVDPAAG